jgi:hypothetical protein
MAFKQKLPPDDCSRIGVQIIERRYGVSPRTLDNWLRTRKIPYYKIGSMLFFSIERCDAALERFQIKPAS